MIINPVLEKDIKTKLRGWRSSVLITSYVFLLGLILLLFFYGNGMLFPNSLQNFDPRMAINGYNLIITFQFALLFLAVPAITATSISSERERQTLDLMLVTNTPARKIILGKIMVSLAHIMLLLIASMPVIGAVFFFGGISIFDIGKLLLFYLITSFFVASCGVFFSTLFKRNIVSIIVTYIFLGLITFGPFLALVIYAFITQNNAAYFNPIYRTYAGFLFPSPVFGFTSFYFSGSYNVYSSFGGYSSFGIISSLAAEFENMIALETGLWRYLKPWLLNGTFSILFSVLLILLSSVALDPTRRNK